MKTILSILNGCVIVLALIFVVKSNILVQNLVFGGEYLTFIFGFIALFSGSFDVYPK